MYFETNAFMSNNTPVIENDNNLNKNKKATTVSNNKIFAGSKFKLIKGEVKAYNINANPKNVYNRIKIKTLDLKKSPSLDKAETYFLLTAPRRLKLNIFKD